MSNPLDNTYAIVRQAAEGVAPVTPAFTYLDNSDANVLNLNSKTLTTSVMKANRGLVGVRKTSFQNAVTIKSELCRHAGYEMLMESALGGTFNSGVLKGSNVDTFHTLEKVALQGSTALRVRATDVVVSKMQLTVDAENFGVVTYTCQGTGRPVDAALITGATYTDPAHGQYMTGADVGSITVGGLTQDYMSLDLSIDQGRDAKFRLGNANAFATGAKGSRMVKLTMKLYRKDFAPEALFVPDTPVAVSFTIGTAGNGYTFTIPAAVAGTIPTSDESGSSSMVTVELMGTYDATSGTDISITKI